MASQFHLLKTRRFLPIFVTQFLGAFNDNVFKNALVVMVTYLGSQDLGMDSRLLVTMAAGIFILPFFLFSSLAGQVVDKNEKSSYISIIKFLEILLMIMAGIGFYFENVLLLMVVLFLMGTQSAFFGPAKYAILPDLLKERELVGGNALVEAGTFLAILFGTILGGILIMLEGGAGAVIVSSILIAMSLAGWMFSWHIPNARPAVPHLQINYNFLVETYLMVSYTARRRDVFLSIVGISWFWLVGFTFLSQFPTYTKDVIGGDEMIVTLFLSVFSVGIALGSLLCNKLTKGEVSAKFVPMGAFGMALFTGILAALSYQLPAVTGDYFMTISEFMHQPLSLGILLSLLMVAICGGIYIVPLYAVMQSRCETAHRSRTIAVNNIMNACFMVLAAIATTLMLKYDLSVIEVFAIIGAINIPAGFVVTKLIKKHGRKAKKS